MIDKMYPLSVIVPVYNVEKYIARCVRSLFSQDMKEIQYIFINDFSPDQSISILEMIINKEYPVLKEDIRIINLSENKGVSNARNLGISLASGEYVTFCDSDDWIDSNMYSSLCTIAKNEDADIVACDFVNEYNDHRVVIRQPYSIDMEDNMKKILLGDIFPSLWSSIVKRQLYIENQIEFPYGLNVGEDLAVNVYLYVNVKKIIHKSYPYYHYRHHSESLCTHRNLSFVESDIQIASNIESFLFKKGLLNLYKKEMAYRKFFSKLPLWTDSQYRNSQRWILTYQETNKYVWHYKRLNWKMKTEYWLALKGYSRCAVFFVKILHCQQTIRDFLLK